MTEPIKYLSATEAVNEGIVQEINRQFLHPLGLALEVTLGDPEREYFYRIWDYRTDPEGVTFDPQMLATPQAAEKARLVALLRAEHAGARRKLLDAVVQPITGLGR